MSGTHEYSRLGHEVSRFNEVYMKQRQPRMLPALIAVVITLVVLWTLCQATFGTITVHVPVGVPTPTPVVQHHASSHHK